MEQEKKPSKSDDEESLNYDIEIEELKFNFNFLSEEACKSTKEGKKLKADSIFIAAFGPASVYLQTYVQKKATLIAYLNFNKAKQQSLANLYFLNNSEESQPEQYALIFNDEVKTFQNYNFSEFFFNYFDLDSLKYCILLDSKTKNLMNKIEIKAKFKDNNLRIMQSSKSLESNSIEICQSLEDNNCIEGISAEIMIFLEHNQKCSDLYIALCNEFEINYQDVSQFDFLKKKYLFLRNQDLKESEFTINIKNANKKRMGNNMYI